MASPSPMTKDATLVSWFRRSHEQLVAAICDVQVCQREYAQAKPKLSVLYTLLLEHLAKQDKEFFQRVTASLADDRPAGKTLEFLEHDLKELKIAYLTFMDKHSAELADQHPNSFIKDFSNFSQTILARIKVEEEYLLPLLYREEPAK